MGSRYFFPFFPRTPFTFSKIKARGERSETSFPKRPIKEFRSASLCPRAFRFRLREEMPSQGGEPTTRSGARPAARFILDAESFRKSALTAFPMFR